MGKKTYFHLFPTWSSSFFPEKGQNVRGERILLVACPRFHSPLWWKHFKLFFVSSPSPSLPFFSPFVPGLAEWRKRTDGAAEIVSSQKGSRLFGSAEEEKTLVWLPVFDDARSGPSYYFVLSQHFPVVFVSLRDNIHNR